MFSRVLQVTAMVALLGAPAQAQITLGKKAPTTPTAPTPKSAPTTPLTTVAAPQGVTVTATSAGPVVSWKAASGAASYQVLRTASGSSTATVIASVAVTTLSYLDRGFNANASYQVAAVASTQQKATSAAVGYLFAIPVAPIPVTLAPPSFDYSAFPYNATLTVGDTVVVTGKNFGTVKSLTVVRNAQVCLGFPSFSCNDACSLTSDNCTPDTTFVEASAAAIKPSTTSFSFIVPAPRDMSSAPGSVAPYVYYLHVVMGTTSATLSPFRVQSRP